MEACTTELKGAEATREGRTRLMRIADIGALVRGEGAERVTLQTALGRGTWRMRWVRSARLCAASTYATCRSVGWGICWLFMACLIHRLNSLAAALTGSRLVSRLPAPRPTSDPALAYPPSGPARRQMGAGSTVRAVCSRHGTRRLVAPASLPLQRL
eukprot:88901-Rhodomonas_salina.1